MKRRAVSMREDLYFALVGYTAKLNEEKVWEGGSAQIPNQVGYGYSTTEVSGLILLGILPPVPKWAHENWESYRGVDPRLTPPKRKGRKRLMKNPFPEFPKTSEVVDLEPEGRAIPSPDFKPADRERLSKGEPAKEIKPKDKSTDFTGGGVNMF